MGGLPLILIAAGVGKLILEVKNATQLPSQVRLADKTLHARD
jgi:hypothetical protein